MDRIAVRVLRGDVVESVHRASVAVTNRQGRLVASFGDPRLVTFVRSSIKPVQALPILETGALEHFGFPEDELAVMCASHNGEPMHTERVRRILDRIGLAADALRCGAHAPYRKEAAEVVGKDFSSLHNNCSGKHAGMLAVCVHRGWDTATYLEPNHPLQQTILDRVVEETGVPKSEIRIGTDGCSAPNFALPLKSTARAFARLMDAEAIRGDRGRSLRQIRDAMLAHPELVAGEDRTDTQFMRAFAGDVWVKAGGESCYGLGVRSLKLGAVVKIEDGAGRAIPPLLFRVLEQLGIATDQHRRTLDGLWRPALTNWAGKRVGSIEAVASLRSHARRLRLPA